MELADPLTFNVSGQVSIQDSYVTKTGSSNVSDGDINFVSDDHGIQFFGGCKIVKEKGGGLAIYPGADPHKVRMYNNSGLNPSPVATERYVEELVAEFGRRSELAEVMKSLVGAMRILTPPGAAAADLQEYTQLQSLLAQAWSAFE